MNVGLVLSNKALIDAGKKDLEKQKEEDHVVAFKKVIESLSDTKEIDRSFESGITKGASKKNPDAVIDLNLTEIDLDTAIRGIITDISKEEPILKDILLEAGERDLEDALSQVVDIVSVLPKNVLENLDRKNLITVFNSSKAIAEENKGAGRAEALQYNLNLLTQSIEQLLNSNRTGYGQQLFNMTSKGSDYTLNNTFYSNKVSSTEMKLVGSLKNEASFEKAIGTIDKSGSSVPINQIESHIIISPNDIHLGMQQSDLKSTLSFLKSMMNILKKTSNEDSAFNLPDFSEGRGLPDEMSNKPYTGTDLEGISPNDIHLGMQQSDLKSTLSFLKSMMNILKKTSSEDSVFNPSDFSEGGGLPAEMNYKPLIETDLKEFTEDEVARLETLLENLIEILSEDSPKNLKVAEQEIDVEGLPGNFMKMASDTGVLQKLLNIVEELESKGLESRLSVLNNENLFVKNTLDDTWRETDLQTAATKSSGKEKLTQIKNMTPVSLGENQEISDEKEQEIIHRTSKGMDVIEPKGRLRILEEAFTRNQLSEVHEKVYRRLPSISVKENTPIFLNNNKSSESGRSKITTENIISMLSTNNSVSMFQQTFPRTDQYNLVLKTGESEQTFQQFTKDFTGIIGKSQILNTPNMSKLLIKLYPEQLGSIRIEILQQNGVITAKLLASTKTTKELLDSQLSGLRQAFASQNLQVDKIEVSQTLLESYRQERQSSHHHHGQQQREQKQDEQQAGKNAVEHDFKELLNMTELI
ncbi:flagellar hook-length control protein FliK [Rossellomorea vietnamensis]|uniref:flagellar hook-length control protein FliK n=1 Tax=Rossellomorea vietnamensis TaxID=218284 RepID=UPI003CE6E2AE